MPSDPHGNGPDLRGLSGLLDGLEPIEVLGADSVAVSGLCCDPDKIHAHALFIAVRCWHINAHRVIDGHDHIAEAVEAGASAVVCEQLPERRREGVCYLRVEDSSAALTTLAGAWFGHPGRSLKLVGGTGTNGKTTIATSLYRLFGLLGHRCGLISTIENRIGDRAVATTRTTPDILELNGLMHAMVEQGCTHCFMEVSSHGIDQGRIAGLRFDGAIFTNLGRDHLDYHPDLEHYARTKKRFFDQLDERAFALTNRDDARGDFMTGDCPGRVYGYGLDESSAFFRARILANRLSGLVLEFNGHPVQCRLNGAFNAYNLLAVYAAARLLGEEEVAVLAALQDLPPVQGRLEWMQSGDGITGIVDYAHTPDALREVLKAINAVKPPQGRVLTVLGCGGNRDQDKRPLMAATAHRHSDQLIFTSDNPRYEDPRDIVDDMKQGLSGDELDQTLTLLDRPQAIHEACRQARAGDVILVAGKGHERFQEINGGRHPCHDMSVLQEALAQPRS